MKIKKLITAVLAFILVPAAAFAGLLNQKAPDFSLQDLGGKAVSLSDFRGKVVFIDFWASWCPPCKKEFPELNKLLERYKDADVAVLAVNVDTKKAHAEGFVSGYPGLSKKFFVLHDPGANVIRAYNAQAMPTSFIVDKSGVIRNIHFGYRDSDPQEWAVEIDRLLK